MIGLSRLKRLILGKRKATPDLCLLLFEIESKAISKIRGSKAKYSSRVNTLAKKLETELAIIRQKNLAKGV